MGHFRQNKESMTTSVSSKLFLPGTQTTPSARHWDLQRTGVVRSAPIGRLAAWADINYSHNIKVPQNSQKICCRMALSYNGALRYKPPL